MIDSNNDRKLKHPGNAALSPGARLAAHKAKRSVLTVGEGRGFVVTCRQERLVVTAAHCLPFFPVCHSMTGLAERTYAALLAPLGREPAVWAECLFADPVADIAVLGSPDNQDLYEQADAYEALVQSASSIAIADAPLKGKGWLLSLEGQWFGCTVQYLKRVKGTLWISNTTQPIVGGMSGSPVISDNGAAIGIVAVGKMSGCQDCCEDQYGSKNPRLVRDLPGWLLYAQRNHSRRKKWLARATDQRRSKTAA
jgi:Trypsin-like peptidase domain